MRAAPERHMSHLHRLHTDDEGVRQHGEEQQRRRHAADGGLSLGEVHRVNNRGGCVQDERDRVQRAVGA